MKSPHIKRNLLLSMVLIICIGLTGCSKTNNSNNQTKVINIETINPEIIENEIIEQTEEEIELINEEFDKILKINEIIIGDTIQQVRRMFGNDLLMLSEIQEIKTYTLKSEPRTNITFVNEVVSKISIKNNELSLHKGIKVGSTKKEILEKHSEILQNISKEVLDNTFLIGVYGEDSIIIGKEINNVLILKLDEQLETISEIKLINVLNESKPVVFDNAWTQNNIFEYLQTIYNLQTYQKTLSEEQSVSFLNKLDNEKQVQFGIMTSLLNSKNNELPVIEHLRNLSIQFAEERDRERELENQ